ncbi:MAG TPA: hypothetical protein VF447_03785 [Terriglobales bacterium]
METTRRELSIFAAEMMGAQAWAGQFNPRRVRHDRQLFRDNFETSSLPYMILDPRPGLHIVDVNDAYISATITPRDQAVGRKLFDVYPDNPEDRDANGVANLFESLQWAAQRSMPHAMGVQRYDVLNEAGQFVPMYWRPVNTPIFDNNGRLTYLLHHVKKVDSQSRVMINQTKI